jgi:hypothetical protein
LQGGFPSGKYDDLLAEWQALASQIGDDFPINPTFIKPADLTTQISTMIPTGATGAKFPTDLSQHIEDLYEFDSFTYHLLSRNYDINLSQARNVESEMEK